MYVFLIPRVCKKSTSYFNGGAVARNHSQLHSSANEMTTEIYRTFVLGVDTGSVGASSKFSKLSNEEKIQRLSRVSRSIRVLSEKLFETDGSPRPLETRIKNNPAFKSAWECFKFNYEEVRLLAKDSPDTHLQVPGFAGIMVRAHDLKRTNRSHLQIAQNFTRLAMQFVRVLYAEVQEVPAPVATAEDVASATETVIAAVPGIVNMEVRALAEITAAEALLALREATSHRRKRSRSEDELPEDFDCIVSVYYPVIGTFEYY